MRKLFLSLVFILGVILNSPAVADGPDVEWEKTFGGSYFEEARSVQQTSDGGYIIAGETHSFAGYSDVYLIKTDGSGNKQWEKTFGGSYSDWSEAVQQTSDGGYIITGASDSSSRDAFLIKTDSSGNKQWEKTFGGSYEEYGISVQQTLDGGYIIAGITESFGMGDWDVYLIKTDGSGNKQWEKTFGGSERDGGRSVEQTSDGGYIIVGHTQSFGTVGIDVYLIKTDGSGNKQWEKTFGGSSHELGYSVNQTSDGGYIIAGETQSFGMGKFDFYLIKTDGSGNKQWEKTFGGSDQERGNDGQQTSDGGYIIAGETKSFGMGGYDVYLIKTDNSGNKQWEKTFGGSDQERGNDVQETLDGGYIIAGSTGSFGAVSWDVYLIKLKEPHPVQLTGTNCWDGRNIKLEWDKGVGEVKLIRTGGGEPSFEKNLSSSFYYDIVPKSGEGYTYVLKNASDVNLSNEAKVKAEVIVVLVRGYSPTKSGRVNDDYWKPNGLVELVDVNEWFTSNGITCWVPPQGIGPGEGLSGWKTIGDNALELENFINSKRVGIYADASVNLIGHSMGGLISRKYAKNNPNIVDRIFCIQTPHTGSPLAELKYFWFDKNNDATENLKPSYLEDFNKQYHELEDTRLYSFWSMNWTDVLNDWKLWTGAGLISGLDATSHRFFPGSSDGAVPMQSAMGMIYGIEQVVIDTLSNSNLDHYSCYRHPDTLEKIMDWMGLPYSQEESMAMSFAAAAESAEPNITPLYFVAGFGGEFDSSTPVSEVASISDSTKAYFRAITSDANCIFTLSDPCGVTYDPCYAAGEIDITYETEDQIFLYDVNSPVPGTWTLNLSTTIAPPNSVDYGLTVFEDANIALYSYTDPTWANTDTNILILAELTESNNPIIDANLTANITLPDTNVVQLTLYDDGLYDDVNANDGIYTDMFTTTNQVGVYSGQIAATGTLSGVDDYNDTIINWSYNALNRLTGEDYNAPDDVNDFNNVYVYNLIGNRLQKQIEGGNTTYYTYDPDNDELDSETTDGNSITFSYDLNGALTQAIRDNDANSYHTYNLMGRMASAADDSTTVTYDYSPDGIRIESVSGGTTTKYLIDPYNHTGYAQVLKTDDGTNKVFYTIGHDVLAQATNIKAPEFFLYDGHGSVRHLADNTGAITESYNYDAYGNAHGFTPGSAATNLLYTGEWHDSTAQQYYLRARWYSPATGRFNKMDPFAGNNQDPQSLHKYLYVHNNPVNGIDPSGKFTITGMVVNMAIGSMLNRIVMPVLAPILNKVTSSFIPDWLKSMILFESPTAIMGGASISATAGHTVGAGFTGLVEALWFPGARKLAAYHAEGITGGFMIGGGAGVTGSLFGGLVYGAQNPDNYTKTFFSVTLAFRSLTNKLQGKIENALTNFISELTLVSPSAPDAVEQLAQVRRGARGAAQAIGLKNDAVISLFGDPSGKVGGFSIGASGTLGKGLDLSFSWLEYKKFWEWGY